MAGSHAHGVLGGEPSQFLVISFDTDQTGAGSLTETYSELGMRTARNDYLIEILDGLDEVALAYNDIAAFGNGKTYVFNFHDTPHEIGFRMQDSGCTIVDHAS